MDFKPGCLTPHPLYLHSSIIPSGGFGRCESIHSSFIQHSLPECLLSDEQESVHELRYGGDEIDKIDEDPNSYGAESLEGGDDRMPLT